MRHALCVCLLAAGWILVSPALLADDASAARGILEASGVRAGLCVLLGCGGQETPGLAAALADHSDLLVHGLAIDDAARARAATEARGLAARAMVEDGGVGRAGLRAGSVARGAAGRAAGGRAGVEDREGEVERPPLDRSAAAA